VSCVCDKLSNVERHPKGPVAPIHARALPLEARCLANPRRGILSVGTSAAVQVRKRPIMRPGGKPRSSIHLFRLVQVWTIPWARKSSKRHRGKLAESALRGNYAILLH
jgi:hypothetical protein